MTDTEDRLPIWDDRTNWGLFLPPSRPARCELEIVRERLSACGRDATVGILGSTPEFRDCVAAADVGNTFVFEQNEDFHDAINHLCTRNGEEQLVKGDWRETIPEFHNELDILLSHSTIGNIPYTDREAFYQAVSQALRPDGLFIDKVLTNDAPPQTLAELDEVYRNRPFNLATINDFANAYFFTSELTYEAEIVDVNNIESALDKRFEHPLLRRLLSETVPHLYPNGSVWYYGKPWESVKKPYMKSLQVVEYVPEPSHSVFEERCGVFVTRPAG